MNRLPVIAACLLSSSPVMWVERRRFVSWWKGGIRRVVLDPRKRTLCVEIEGTTEVVMLLDIQDQFYRRSSVHPGS